MKLEIEGKLLSNFPTTTARIDLWYPTNPDSVTALEIGLQHVRAANSIRIHYDFDRDGWSVMQTETIAEHETWMETGEFVEVAFIPAWGEPPAAPMQQAPTSPTAPSQRPEARRG